MFLNAAYIKKVPPVIALLPSNTVTSRQGIFQQKEMEMTQTDKQRRMSELLEKARETGGEAERARILQERGRLCISETWIKKAKQAAKTAANDGEFLDNLEKVYPMLKRGQGKVYVVYPKCYCHLKKQFGGDVPHWYCECTVGWTRAMFEQALNRSVDVKLESSVIRGGKECRLRVMLESPKY